ncbi:hypothetical protein M5K25_002051 [Dendrobium thyrsiflorum]|uniref:Reverse transcriptase zinc-binding domain-containing protein n=1 Tax=Dendrobium thyrsiflorum TaxID=117978 RepID=A0ABD0W0W7_DENTH
MTKPFLEALTLESPKPFFFSLSASLGCAQKLRKACCLRPEEWTVNLFNVGQQKMLKQNRLCSLQSNKDLSIAAKKVDALEQCLEGEMNQIKATMEDRIFSMEEQFSNLRDMVKKILDLHNQTAASKARGPEGKNTNSKICRGENDVENVEGEGRRLHLESFQREERGRRYGERRGYVGYEQKGADWERKEVDYSRRCADFEGRRGEFEEGFGYERGRENQNTWGIDQNITKDQVELTKLVSGKSISVLAFEAEMQYPTIKLYWNWIKKIKLNPRVEVFWWRLHHNAIPTFRFLEQRRLRDGNLCPRRCMVMEDYEHVAASCSKLDQIVQILNEWGFEIPYFGSFHDSRSWLEKSASNNVFLANLYCSAVFLCWKSRNKLVYENKEDSSLIIATNSVEIASISLSDELTRASGVLINRFGCLKMLGIPLLLWIKVNADASLSSSYKAGVGAFGFNGVHWDISRLEMLAVHNLDLVFKDWMMQYKGIIIEGDNVNVIKYIQDGLKKMEAYKFGIGSEACELDFFFVSSYKTCGFSSSWLLTCFFYTQVTIPSVSFFSQVSKQRLVVGKLLVEDKAWLISSVVDHLLSSLEAFVYSVPASVWYQSKLGYP